MPLRLLLLRGFLGGVSAAGGYVPHGKLYTRCSGVYCDFQCIESCNLHDFLAASTQNVRITPWIAGHSLTQSIEQPPG
jgi:hypothetical protein